MFCHNNKAFLFGLPKLWSRSRLKKGSSGSRLRPTKKLAPAPPQKWGLQAAPAPQNSYNVVSVDDARINKKLFSTKTEKYF